uniref:TATA-box-binding protein-like protein n=1 Tax=Moumouvirus sp. 'Monve' TaxID=1128131 RepID=H2EEP3_9VIRU|nr:TATA-box-binding protein-like protein [Moumouvirus Monve]
MTSKTTELKTVQYKYYKQGKTTKSSGSKTTNKDLIKTDKPIENIQNYINAYNDTKNFLKNHKISVSTITLDCKLGTLIDVDKFAKYVVLKENEIVSVKFGNRNDPATNRIIPAADIKTKKKPSKKTFIIK